MTRRRIALIGTSGYGAWHLDNMLRLQAAERVEVVGLCNRRPPAAALRARLPDVPFYTDVADLLDSVQPEITVVSTPLHTHHPLAAAALRAGSHLLLEKPPVTTLVDHDHLAALQHEHGRAVQVGFQSFGSLAIPAARRLIDDGAIGRIEGIGVAGAWVREASYYTRSPWAGRRELDGQPVVDGPLTNAFAHAVATALRLDGADRRGQLRRIAVELYRANPIEADDTSSLSLLTAGGTRIVVSVTLCAAMDHEPYLLVVGSRGSIRLEYKTHRLELLRAGEAVGDSSHGCVDLLENLLDHLDDPSAELLSPLARSGAFMEVLEAVRRAPAPRPIPASAIDVRPGVDSEHHVVRGVDEAVRRSARELVTFGELGVGWARAASQVGPTRGSAVQRRSSS